MSKIIKNILIRAVRNRMAAGETFEDIIKSYPGLKKNEIAEIREAFSTTETA